MTTIAIMTSISVKPRCVECFLTDLFSCVIVVPK